MVIVLPILAIVLPKVCIAPPICRATSEVKFLTSLCAVCRGATKPEVSKIICPSATPISTDILSPLFAKLRYLGKFVIFADCFKSEI